jgi:DNA-binding NarL/FixJ family response regulator
MLRTIIYEDNTDLRAALAALIGGTPGYELVGAFGDCTEVVAQCRTLRPEVVLMDIDMPKMNGIEGTRLLKKALPEVEIVMLTVFDDDGRVFDAVMAGASGYLLKQTPPSQILSALLEVKAGGAPMTPVIARKVLGFSQQQKAKDSLLDALSPRELDVLKALAKGLSYKMVADELEISTDTVRSHVRKIYDKLHVHSLPEAVSKVFLK